MIGPMEKKPSIRIAGYLEKKGKIRMVVSRWKRWWFVLEGRLLLYYQSQLEYLNLSPCRGSLNMGLAAGVRPGKALQLIVTTRSQTVILRTSNCVEHEQWLQSLMDAMALPNSISTFNSRPVMHFRYRDNYHDNIIQQISSLKCPSYGAIFDDNGLTSGQSDSYKTCSSSNVGLGASQSERSVLCRVLSDSRTLLRRPCKRDSTRNSSRLSKIAFSDTSIPARSQVNNLSEANSNEKCQSMQELRNSISEDQLQIECISLDPVIDKKVITGSRESKLSGSIKIELSLEEVKSKTSENLKEKKIGNVKIVLDGCTIYGTKNNQVEDLSRINSKQLKGSSVNKHVEYTYPKRLTQLYSNKESKSDGNLVSIRQKIRTQSVSCENMETLDRSIGSTYNDNSTKIEVVDKENRGSKLKPSQSISSQGCLGRKVNKKRSHSILSRFRDSKSDTDEGNFERGGTIRKRLSFLRKMWKKRERKTEEEDYDSNDYESIPVVIELPSPEIIEKPEDILKSFDRQLDCSPEPEPPPDYDTSLTEEVDMPPMLPPREQKERPVSPWHDIPKNNQPVEPMEEDNPPPLPLKNKHKNICRLSIEQAKLIDPSEEQKSNSSEDDSITCEPPSRNGYQQLEDLDTLLAKLTEVNTYVVRQIDISQNCNGNIVQVSAARESDYDVPRPHVSLVATLRSQNTRSETFTPTNFLCTTPLVDIDSLDPVVNRLESEITPDSLECDSQWSLVPATADSHSPHSGSMLHHFINTEDKFFPDSLNS